jgi:hypothetical protein
MFATDLMLNTYLLYITLIWFAATEYMLKPKDVRRWGDKWACGLVEEWLSDHSRTVSVVILFTDRMLTVGIGCAWGGYNSDSDFMGYKSDPYSVSHFLLADRHAQFRHKKYLLKQTLPIFSRNGMAAVTSMR